MSRVGETTPIQWNTEFLFTRLEFDASALLDARLDEKDYATIGQAIVIRLAAQQKTMKRLGGG